MEYRGTIRSGVVVFDSGGTALPDGTPVRVTPIGTPQTPPPSTLGDASGTGTLRELLLKFAGRASGLPGDAARNHDHYLYGTPKR